MSSAYRALVELVPFRVIAPFVQERSARKSKNAGEDARVFIYLS